MDLKGSLVDTKLRIYPSKTLLDFLHNTPISDDTPVNIVKFVKGEDFTYKSRDKIDVKQILVTLNNNDIENIKKIKQNLKTTEPTETVSEEVNETTSKDVDTKAPEDEDIDSVAVKERKNEEKPKEQEKEGTYLTTQDMDWLYDHLHKRRNNGEKDVPYLHTLLEGAHIVLPDNKVIKRNPVLEERCVKLRAQQEARDYRKMTKSVDNVRMRFPEDSISYQLKQVNRQLIAVGQFILSIFAGFLFGFKGVEWMIGELDFGFKLLLGVMCALVIALAEIYFLAKKLNEELNVPETIQLGGPPKFAEERTCHGHKISSIDKEHQD